MPGDRTSRGGRFAIVLALLTALFAAAGAVRAETPTFSHVALDSLGDLIRREIAADKFPAACC